MVIGSAHKLAYGEMVRELGHEFRVASSVYTDPQIFEDEMRGIFEMTWVYVAHVSEIPNRGDFRTAAVGRLPVIVSRGADDRVHVLLNVCRHRGSVICREERGNTESFQCPYHGWVYSTDGTLTGVSDRKGYPEEWGPDLGLGGLVHAPRMGIYRGLIFASFSEEGESLEEHIGPMREYVNLWFDQSPVGAVRLLKPHRSYYPANWKLVLENTTDGLHARYVHASAFRTQEHFKLRDPQRGWAGRMMGYPRGHAIHERPFLRTPLSPEVRERYAALLAERHGAERAELLFSGRHITFFPNLHLMEYKFRIVQPVSVDKTIVYEFPALLEGVPEEVNAALTRRLVSGESAVHSGFVNADDPEIFTYVQSGLRASRQMEWLDLSRGLHQETVDPTGERIGNDTSETPQRSIYREWARLMGELPAQEGQS